MSCCRCPPRWRPPLRGSTGGRPAGDLRVGHSGSMALRTNKQWWGVALDAPDGPALAHFYERLLGWTIFTESPGWTTLAPSKEAGYNLAFMTEEKYVRPVWPAQDGQQQMSMHLDIEVDDLEAAVAYAVE